MEGEGTIFDADDEYLRRNLQTPEKRLLRRSGKTALFVLFLIGLGMSMAFPYGMAFAVVSWIIALTGTVFVVGFVCYRLLKDMLGGTATFGYTPTTSYMAGKKTRRRRKTDPADDETRDDE